MTGFVSYNSLAGRNTRLVRETLTRRGFTTENTYVRSSSWTGDTFIFYSDPKDRDKIDRVLNYLGFIDRWYVRAPEFCVIMCYKPMGRRNDSRQLHN